MVNVTATSLDCGCEIDEVEQIYRIDDEYMCRSCAIEELESMTVKQLLERIDVDDLLELMGYESVETEEAAQQIELRYFDEEDEDRNFSFADDE